MAVHRNHRDLIVAKIEALFDAGTLVVPIKGSDEAAMCALNWMIRRRIVEVADWSPELGITYIRRPA